MNRNGSRASSRSTKPKKLIRPPRASAARSADGGSGGRSPRLGQCAAPQCAPQPTSTSSGTSSVERRLGGARHHLADHRRGRFLAARRAPRTPVRRGPGAASGRRSSPAVGERRVHPAIARLMRSALVPWIGALIAARSAPARKFGLRRADVGEVGLAAEQGAGEAVLADEGQRVVDVIADAREALEIAVDDRLALVLATRPAARPGPTTKCRRGWRN